MKLGLNIASFRPPYKTYRGNFNYYPMKIGDHVHIGANSVVEAATIGNHVEIGKNCVIVGSIRVSFNLNINLYAQGKFTIIKDCAKIADNTIVPPNTVIPALALFSGSPGLVTFDILSTTCSHLQYIQVVLLRTSRNQPRRWLRSKRSSFTPGFNPRNGDTSKLLQYTLSAIPIECWGYQRPTSSDKLPLNNAQ